MEIPFPNLTTVTRRSGAYNDAGDWEPNEPETVVINACVQSLNKESQGGYPLEKLERLGVQYPGGLCGFSSDKELLIGLKESEGVTYRADIFTWQGKIYEVCEVSPRDAFPPTHWEGIAGIIDEKVANAA